MAVLYLLDTNILLAYVRAGGLYAFIETKYSLWTMTPAPIVSVVSEGEIRALAEEFAWGTGKRRLMEDLLARFNCPPALCRCDRFLRSGFGIQPQSGSHDG